MTPIRIAIVVILIYILYRLIVGPRKKPQDIADRKGTDSNMGKLRSDTLVEDPVCHTYVPKRQAIMAEYDHHQYHFCSEKCRETFLSEKGRK